MFVRSTGGGETTVSAGAARRAHHSAAGAFVGRRRELELLGGALRRARGGHGGLVLLVGEPGIGKSRTAEEFGRRALRKGAGVHWGRCHEAADAPAYWPWTQALGAYSDAHDGATLRSQLGGEAPLLGTMLPRLRERLSDLAPPARVDRFALFESVVAFVRRAATSAPLVLVFDDLHWADEASLRLLRFATPDLADSRVLVIGTYRQIELSARPDVMALVAELASLALCVPLAGLHRHDVARLVRDIAGRPPPPRLVSAIYRRTGGNPFFVDAVCRLLVAECPSGPLRVRRLRIPVEVGAAIRARLGRLGSALQRLLRIAAVIGREVDPVVLAHAASVSSALLQRRLRLAVALGILDEVSRPVHHYRFAHVLVRESLYEELSAARRERLHGIVGRAIEKIYAADLDPHLPALAHHFALATLRGAGGRAHSYAMRAGERAAAMLAHEEAVRHFRAALTLLDRGPSNDASRGRVLLALGDAVRRTGQSAAARATFRRAAALGRRTGAAELFGQAALGLAGPWIAMEAAENKETVAVLEEALSTVTRSSPLRVRLLARLGGELWQAECNERRQHLTARAVEEARRLGDHTALAFALSYRRLAVWESDNVPGRLAIDDEIIRLGQESGDPEITLEGYSWRVTDLLEQGDVMQADAAIASHAELARELRLPAHRWTAVSWQAMRATVDGRFADAERAITAAAALSERAQMVSYLQEAETLQRFALRREQGRIDEVAGRVELAAQRSPAFTGMQLWAMAVSAASGRLATAHDRFERAARADFADLPSDMVRFLALAFCAETCAALDDQPRAATLYALLLPHAGSHVVISNGRVHYDSVSRLLGLLAATGRRWAEADAHFIAACAALARMGARPRLAWTQCDHAAMLLARGDPADRERAEALCGTAHETARALGMPGLVRRLETLGTSDGAVALGASGERVSSVFRREGEFWTIVYAGRVLRLRDSRGLRHIAQLLGRPGEDLHVFDLSGATVQSSALCRRPAGDDALLDQQARATYRRRLEELRGELDEARAANDLARTDRATAEMDFLKRQLMSATGIGRAGRRASPEVERARVNVTRTIRLALAKITAEHPQLGRLLDRSIRTGTVCRYAPDPDQPLVWTLL
jgi:tetratricopeptide (TPR) repeat protein